MVAGDVIDLVSRMRRLGLSRNRNFETFATPIGLRARRLLHFLRSLEHDLARALALGPRARVAVEPAEGGRFQVTIEELGVRSRRVAKLSAAEWDLLRDSPSARVFIDPPSG